jgi:Uncharacterized protein conserved in bacteria (DUF2188)
MAKVSQHVVRSSDGGWVVKKGGSQKATKRFDTQHEAIEWGREIAKNQHAEFYIHEVDGKIREKKSYSDDSAPSKDQRKL